MAGDGPGRGERVSDREILELFGDDLIYSTRELADKTSIKHNSILPRLNDLEDRNLVASKKIGAGLAWWLTDDGRDALESDGEV